MYEIAEKENIKVFDSTQEETLVDRMTKALTTTRNHRRYYRDMEADLGGRASQYKAVFSNLYDLATINNNGETRDMLQYRDFKEFKENFNYTYIRNFLRDLEMDIRHLEEKLPRYSAQFEEHLIEGEEQVSERFLICMHNEITVKKHIAKVLQSLIDLKASC